MLFAYLKKLPCEDKKKFEIYVHDPHFRKTKTIKFGANGYEDFTIHKDINRKKRYITRHIKNEDFDDPYTAGFWATNLLWNKPTIKQSIDDIESKYDIIVFIRS